VFAKFKSKLNISKYSVALKYEWHLAENYDTFRQQLTICFYPELLTLNPLTWKIW